LLRHVGVAILLIVLVGCEGTPEYVRKNELLLKNLPTPTGASLIGQTTVPYRNEISEDIDGYVTMASYSVPSTTSDEDVIRFYIDALGDWWKHCRFEFAISPGWPRASPKPPLPGADGIKSASFIRGRQLVEVVTDGLFPDRRDGTYGINLDHSSPTDPCNGEYSQP